MSQLDAQRARERARIAGLVASARSHFAGAFPAAVRDPLRAQPPRRALRQPEATPLPPYTGPLPPVHVIALNRMGFGPRPGDVEAFMALGATDQARLQAYVEQQLDPVSLDDSDVAARAAAAGYTTLDKSRSELWLEHYHADDWDGYSQPLYELQGMKFLRAIHSRRQLLELLVDFWHDHFNVYAWDETGFPMMPDHERGLRTHALGNFRAMLTHVAQSAVMLYYLDNVYSHKDGPNENWARELLELHTLGAANYYGALPPDQVPGYPHATAGYVEADVFAVARAFTGWSLRNADWDAAIGSTGAFLFQSDWHDTDAKQLLGHTLPAGRGLRDGYHVLDLLAEHPGTARHVCTKLCRRLIGDQPPQELVASAAAIFQANVAAPDQIAQVVRHILLSAAFRTTWGQKIKRPFHAFASAMRAGGGDFDFRIRQDMTWWFLWMYEQTGQPVYGWPAPNGYPDIAPFWQASSSLLARWKLLNWLPDWWLDHNGNDRWMMDVLPQMPPAVRSANAVVDFWCRRLLGFVPQDPTRHLLVTFMAQGYNADYALPVASDEYTRDRVRALVGLIFMSPEFQWC